MKFQLLPKNYSFIEQYEQVSENIKNISLELDKLVQESNIKDEKISKKINDDIYEYTLIGRRNTREIIDHIEASFITPFDREDLHDLAEHLGHVVEEMHNASDLVILHKVNVYDENLFEYSKNISKAVDVLVDLTKGLVKLKAIDEMVDEINEIKRQTRQHFRNSIAYLFSGELDAFQVLKFKNVYETFADIVYQINIVADIIRTIALKHA